MSRALVDVLVFVLVPLVIGCVCLLMRRDNRQAILVFSMIALALGGFDFIVYFFELAGTIPITSPAPDYALIDVFRILCYDVAFYVAVVAWAFALFRAAQTGRLGWMMALLVVAMVSLVSAGIAGNPYVFFSRLRYTGLYALVFAAGGHLLPLLTLIYALATQSRIIPVNVPPVPPFYPPMMYPPPTPYGQPAPYVPPPAVVLPMPQPQPPTMTPPL